MSEQVIMLASPGSQFNFSCTLCPRTFKLQEFYDKHLKVHQLKKQHVCTVCGFVYGAAKGLEGHMDSAHPEPLPPTHSNTPPVVRRIEQPEDLSTQMLEKMPEMPFFHFLHAQGALRPRGGVRLLAEADAEDLLSMCKREQQQVRRHPHQPCVEGHDALR